MKMTDQELLHKILTDDDSEILDELRQKLNAELEKPIADRDFDYIDDLAKTIDEITGEDRNTADIADRGIKAIHDKLYHSFNRKHTKRLRWWIPAACIILLLSSNIWSYSAYGMNAFSAVYQILNGGIKIDLHSQNPTEIYSGNLYADEMKKICEDNQIEAVIPEYIPEGFKPAAGYGDGKASSDNTRVVFYFSKSGKKLNLVVTDYLDTVDPPQIGFPTDNYHVGEQVIQGKTVYVLKEDERYTAAFMIDHTQYLLYADHLDFDECQRILYSMFE